MGEKKIEGRSLTEEMITERLERIADKMVRAKPREYMDFVEFQEKVADWSESTLRRRIKDEGFPAIRDGNGFLIPREEMKLWFSKRKFQP